VIEGNFLIETIVGGVDDGARGDDCEEGPVAAV
jgi:hypothetical protein